MRLKRSDKVKKGLRTHTMMHNGCVGCPYKEIGNRCTETMLKDALALLQQFEADNAQQARCIENLTDKLNATNDALAHTQQLKQERDALKTELGWIKSPEAMGK